MIGIIAAMNEEIEEIKKYMEEIYRETKYENDFFVGKIGKDEVVLTVCGVGKVNAARITQIIIDNYNPKFIINIGVAGGISKNLNFGDIVIGEKVAQYDFDLTAFGRKRGEISDKIGRFICSDKELVNKAEELLEKSQNVNITKGVIASADRFLTDMELSKKIRNEFNADCVEMESGAIAQVCFLDNVPFIVIRSISDVPNEKNKIDYEIYLKKSTENVTKFIIDFLKIM